MIILDFYFLFCIFLWVCTSWGKPQQQFSGYRDSSRYSSSYIFKHTVIEFIYSQIWNIRTIIIYFFKKRTHMFLSIWLLCPVPYSVYLWSKYFGILFPGAKKVISDGQCIQCPLHISCHCAVMLFDEFSPESFLWSILCIWSSKEGLIPPPPQLVWLREAAQEVKAGAPPHAIIPNPTGLLEPSKMPFLSSAVSLWGKQVGTWAQLVKKHRM